MEEILDVYQRPYSPDYPLVCFDESSKQLVKETRIPLPMRAHLAEKYDYEYERNGVCNLFMFSAPLEGWRHVKVTEQHTMIDFAHCMRDLVDLHFPHAKIITVVMDNLSTHKPAALYLAFPPEEARRILDKLVFHFTPKHGSWLNMAEIEFSVLQRQCLDRRIPDAETLVSEIAAWETDRNLAAVTTNWRFTTQDARIKLKHLYPSI